MRLLINQAPKRLNGLFGVIYADGGRASIAPKKLLLALLLQVFYSVRSQRMLMVSGGGVIEPIRGRRDRATLWAA